MHSLSEKLQTLYDQMSAQESAIVAFSGGVDSALVLKIAHEVLDERVIAVTALSESLPAGELEEAGNLARTIGARHVILRTFETRNQDYLANSANRCYFCKTEMYARINSFAKGEGIQ